MSVGRGKMARRAVMATIGAGAAAAATLVTAGAGQAAPAALVVEQVPNVGITVSTGNGITNAFAAQVVAARAQAPGATQLRIHPENANACHSNLATSRAAITWRNSTTGRTDDVVFPVCANGKPSAGVVAATGAGRITFTTTIIDRNQQTFTVSPGSGSFKR